MRCDIRQNSFIELCYSELHLFHLVVQLYNAYLQLGRFSFRKKFHSARNFIRHEISFGTKFHLARNFIRHGTQKPKFDNRKRAPYMGILITAKTRENANSNMADRESFRHLSASNFVIAGGDKVDRRRIWIIKYVKSTSFKQRDKSKRDFPGSTE